MNFGPFLGNEPIRKILSSRLSHAYLIEGEEGSGRHTLARQFCGALLCSRPNPPCGTCSDCRKWVEGSHPDWISISPDCKPEQLRTTLADLWLMPSEAERRVYWIDRAGQMNETLQNILLKSIEEPPEYVVFILIGTPAFPLLPTVRSRCQILTTEPLSEQTLTEELRKEFGPSADLEGALKFSDGYLGKARQFLSGESRQQQERCRQTVQALEQDNVRELLRLCQCKDREELINFCAALGEFYRKRLREKIRTGKPPSPEAAVCEMLDRLELELQKNININLWTVNLLRGLIAAYETQRKGNRSE